MIIILKIYNKNSEKWFDKEFPLDVVENIIEVLQSS